MLKFNDNYQAFVSCFLVMVEVRPPPLFQVFGIGEHLEHGRLEGRGLCALELHKGGKHDKATCGAPSLLRNQFILKWGLSLSLSQRDEGKKK